MTIRHHISDDLLLSYAMGSLAEGWSIAVATHLALCPDCRRRLVEAEEIGGGLLEGTQPQAIEPSSWESVRARLSERPAEKAGRAAVQAEKPIIPRPLRDYLGGDLEAVKWRSLGKGASQCLIRTGENTTQVRLLKIPAGKPVPEHSHGGRELTLVLSGAFEDETGRFGPGDLEDADGSVTHQPRATPDADCICLAVTDAPLRFSSWVVRLVQPILGI
ncbi:anti-sigma-E factor ChrR [Youhaiella tibetensis]|uniref:Transcriptional regulator n=1 Tax=Paradevosia tibetensis TaxID=1447062 RepID=A0A5B9DIJ5_9HYPH|nr:ChrR family anti-sigma-E factor [Youhaiella tibetensis]QEE19070.1 transcriptional regulator [Youhaiella tibetensis]GGF36597.1 anti-sigma-E factor ChrR [Youhaiella tibetensis]